MAEAQIAALIQQVQELQNITRQQAQRLDEQQARIQQGSPDLARILEANTLALQQLAQRGKDYRPSLFDSKGLGRPHIYDGDEAKFHVWAVKTKNYIYGSFPELRRALEFAEDTDVDSIDNAVITSEFGVEADPMDQIENIHALQEQIHTVLTQLTDKEPFDIIENVPSGWGLEAWRRLARRFDPSTGGRKRNLLNLIMYPERQKINGLSAFLEVWEKNVRRYEKRRDDAGNRSIIPDDIKASILESMVPEDLEKHLQLNRSRFKGYVASRAEVALYVENHTGARLRQVDTNHVRDPNAMDIGSMAHGKGKNGKGKAKGKGKGKGAGKGGKGKGKDGKGQRPPANSTFDGTCHNCGRYGHTSRECWRAGGGQANPGQSSAGKGKASGKGHGKHQYMASMEPEHQHPNPQPAPSMAMAPYPATQPGSMGSFDICALYFHMEDNDPDEVDQDHVVEVDGWKVVGSKKNKKKPQQHRVGISNDIMDMSSVAPTQEEYARVALTLDTGAATTGFPLNFAEQFPVNKCVPNEYRTASGEIISDEGSRTVTGWIPGLSQPARLTGRVMDIHKPLVSAAQVTQKGFDIWLGGDESIMIPSNGGLAQALRRCYADYVQKYGLKDSVPVRQERGVFVFDLDVKTQISQPTDTNNFEPDQHLTMAPFDASTASGNPRQAIP